MYTQNFIPEKSNAKYLLIALASAGLIGIQSCGGTQQNKAKPEPNAEESNEVVAKISDSPPNEVVPDKNAKMAVDKKSMPMKIDKSKLPSDINRQAVVKQDSGKVVYWVLPGKRELDSYFGTESEPKLTAKLPPEAPPPLKNLISKLPILIGVPTEKREVNEAGNLQTAFPTPFGDEGIPTSGEFEITYIDRTTSDMQGPPPKTPDDIKAKIQFTDPAGNEYELMPMMVVQPPIPTYSTQGGVMIDDKHHGESLTGSPLMPKVYTYGAFWAVGNVKINGEIADKKKMMHCMTTQIVRNQDYHLALSNELPLAKEETIAGQKHHTHCIVLPVTMTPDGPVHEPVKTAFQLPNGKTQPFIHIMYEKDTIVEGPEWGGPEW